MVGGSGAAQRGAVPCGGALTNGELQAALNLDAAAARALLKQLVAKGLARQEGERRGARYVRAGAAS
jgi:DNA-binding IclR family transcriptional regulator